MKLAKTVSLLIVLLPSGGSFACEAEEVFSARTRYAEEMMVNWQPVQDINATCSEERKKRGRPPYGKKVLACTFWEHSDNGGECHVFTSMDTTVETLGHEVRHCFQGHFHE